MRLTAEGVPDVLTMRQHLEDALEHTDYGEHSWLMSYGYAWPVLIDEGDHIVLPTVDPARPFSAQAVSAIRVDIEGVHTFWGAPLLPPGGSVHVLGDRRPQRVWMALTVQDAVALYLTLRSMYQHSSAVWLVGSIDNLTKAVKSAPVGSVVVTNPAPADMAALLRLRLPVLTADTEFSKLEARERRGLVQQML